MNRRLLFAPALLLLLPAATARAAKGGPDAGNYTWADQNEPFVDSSIPPTTGSPVDIPMADETVTAKIDFPGGFTFPFYGATYSSFVASDNGWLSFDTTVTTPLPSPVSIPGAGAPKLLFAPFWMDLVPGAVSSPFFMEPVQGGLHFRYVANTKATGDYVQIHWILYGSGVIKVWYQFVGDTASAGTGIQKDSATGLGPIFKGTSPQGFVLDNDSVLMYFPPPALKCGTAQTLACGAPVTGAVTAPVGPNVGQYLCSGGTYAAQETVYALTTSDLSNVHLALSNLSPASINLDLFVIAVNACNEFQCIAGGSPSLDLNFLPKGKYYVVVDGVTSLDTGTFTLTATCTKKGETLACQQPADPPKAGTTSGTSVYSSYPCAGTTTLDGPEYVYEVPFTGPGNLRARLSNHATGDVDVLAFPKGTGSLVPASCLDYADEDLVLFGPPSGTYYVVVDGKAGFAGPYSIKVTCGINLDCSIPGTTLLCQTPFNGTTTGAPNKVDDYACSPSVFDGGEAVYRFTLPGTTTLGFAFSGPPDLSMLLMQGGCDEGKCIASGRSLVLRDIPAGDYFLVIDGQNKAAGDFVLTPICQSDLEPKTLTTTLSPGQCETENKTAYVNADVKSLDVLFVQDATNSQANFVANDMKGVLDQIIAELKKLTPDVQFGLASFRDYPATPSSCTYNQKYGEVGDWPWRVDLAMTSDQTALHNAEGALVGAGGADLPEAYARAWYETHNDAAIGWRPNTRRVVVMIGDDVPHDCNVGACLGITKNTRGVDLGRDGAVGGDDLDIMTVTADLAKAGIVPIFVFNPQEPRLPPDDLNFNEVFQLWSCWMKRANGFVLFDQNGVFPPDGAQTIRGFVETASLTCHDLHVAPQAGYAGWMQNLAPPAIADFGVPGSAAFSFDICPPLATAPGTYNFTVDLVCDGVKVANQTVNVTTSNCSYAPVVSVSGKSCPGQTRTFDATGSAIGNCTGPIEYQWRDPSNNPLQTWNTSPIYSTVVSATGDYVLEIRCQDQSACPGSTRKKFTVTVSGGPTADAGADVAACVGQTVGLGSAPVAGMTYSWSPTTYMTPPAGDIANPTVTPTSTAGSPITYTVTVTETATGCTGTDTVVLSVVTGAATGSVGNHLWAAQAGNDVHLDWTKGQLNPRLYNVHRDPAKTSLALPTPTAPVIAGVGVETHDDVGAMSSASPFAPLLFYQVYGRDCSGNSIFQ